MSKWILIALAILSWAGAARGAEVVTSKGTREVLFQLKGLSDLGLSGYLGGIGLRTYVKDGLAFRPALAFGWSRLRTHPEAVPSGQPKPSDSREIDTSVSLELALEKHLVGARSISPYLGACLYGLYLNDKNEPGVIRGADPGTVTKITTKETDGGVLGLLGFEWGWTESLTLGGETRFGLKVTTGKSEVEAIERPDRLTNDRAAFAVGFETAAVFLGVHW